MVEMDAQNRPAPADIEADRRPLKSRQKPAFQKLAALLVKWNASPNGISVVGMLFGVAAGAALWGTAQTHGVAQRSLWIAGALFVQARLVCNLLDGMVAIGSGKQSKVGELYNELPDRVSDSFTLIGLGFAAGGDVQLGYLAALFAMMTACVRSVGKGAGAGADFAGPMAKQQRMFVTTLCALACGASVWLQDRHAATWALWIILIGSALTVLRRIARVARKLKQA